MASDTSLTPVAFAGTLIGAIALVLALFEALPVPGFLALAMTVYCACEFIGRLDFSSVA